MNSQCRYLIAQQELAQERVALFVSQKVSGPGNTELARCARLQFIKLAVDIKLRKALWQSKGNLEHTPQRRRAKDPKPERVRGTLVFSEGAEFPVGVERETKRLVLSPDSGLEFAALELLNDSRGKARVCGPWPIFLREPERLGKSAIAIITQAVCQRAAILGSLFKNGTDKGAAVDVVLQPERAERHAQQAPITDKLLCGLNRTDILREMVRVTLKGRRLVEQVCLSRNGPVQEGEANESSDRNDRGKGHHAAPWASKRASRGRSARSALRQA